MSEPLRPASGPAGRSDLDLRFNGHLRLIAAIGILASAAIATGGLVSLFSREASPPPSKTGPALGLVAPAAAAVDTALALELRVHEAELAAARARAALNDARQLGRDERELESYERRIERLGSSGFESLRRGFGASVDAAQREQERSARARVGEHQDRDDERQRRSHQRAVA
jgi:hypothetical protein